MLFVLWFSPVQAHGSFGDCLAGVIFVQQAVTLRLVEVTGMNEYTDAIRLLGAIRSCMLIMFFLAAAISKCRCRHVQLIKQRVV